MNYRYLELEVLRWAEARGIIANSNPMAQALKTHEELGELLSALHRKNHEEVLDAFGDVVVTLIIAADLYGTDLQTCLAKAYDTIKDRKGYLRADGVFMKEAA